MLRLRLRRVFEHVRERVDRQPGRFLLPVNAAAPQRQDAALGRRVQRAILRFREPHVRNAEAIDRVVEPRRIGEAARHELARPREQTDRFGFVPQAQLFVRQADRQQPAVRAGLGAGQRIQLRAQPLHRAVAYVGVGGRRPRGDLPQRVQHPLMAVHRRILLRARCRQPQQRAGSNQD